MSATTAAPTANMMTKKKAAAVCARLEARRAELEKARAEVGMPLGDTWENYHGRLETALKRYKEVILPPLRDQAELIEKRAAKPAKPSSTALLVTELKAKLAALDRQLMELEKQQSTRDVTEDATKLLAEKATIEKAVSDIEARSPSKSSENGLPQTTKFAVENWVAARLALFEQEVAQGGFPEAPVATSFAAPSNCDLPTFKELGIARNDSAATAHGGNLGVLFA
jgi:hypothetical protein